MGKNNRRNAKNQKGAHKAWGWALVAGALLLFGATVFWPTGNKNMFEADEATISQGGQLYAKNCAACHGPQAEGQFPDKKMGGQLPDGRYIAPALNGTAHMWHHAPDLLFRIVKQGSPAPDSPMVGWKDKMTDDEIGSVLAYLQSIWPEKTRNQYRKSFMTN